MSPAGHNTSSPGEHELPPEVDSCQCHNFCQWKKMQGRSGFQGIIVTIQHQHLSQMNQPPPRTDGKYLDATTLAPWGERIPVAGEQTTEAGQEHAVSKNKQAGRQESNAGRVMHTTEDNLALVRVQLWLKYQTDWQDWVPVWLIGGCGTDREVRSRIIPISNRQWWHSLNYTYIIIQMKVNSFVV